mmetsp:Transcript_7685/g.20691  ORF Transcript_7685/g.20691 Transcript_7685/m.20691 type:complete len:600 (-) Transcript_7685:331-2130(-)
MNSLASAAPNLAELLAKILPQHPPDAEVAPVYLAALAGGAGRVYVHHLLLHVAEGVRGIDLNEFALCVGYLIGLVIGPAEYDDATVLHCSRIRRPRQPANGSEARHVPEDGVWHLAVSGAEEADAARDHGEAGLLACRTTCHLHRSVQPGRRAAEAQFRERREGLGQPAIVGHRRGPREVGLVRGGVHEGPPGPGVHCRAVVVAAGDFHDALLCGRRRGLGEGLVQFAPLEADTTVASRSLVAKGTEVALVRQRVRASVVLRQLSAGDGIDAATLQRVVIAYGVLLFVLLRVINLVADVLPRLLSCVPRPARRDVLAVGDPEHEAWLAQLGGKPLGEGDVARTGCLEYVAALHVVAHHLQLVHGQDRDGTTGAVASKVQPGARLTAQPGEVVVNLACNFSPDLQETLVHAAALAEVPGGPSFETDEVFLSCSQVVAPMVNGTSKGKHAAVEYIWTGSFEVVEGHTRDLAHVSEDGVRVALVLNLDHAHGARLHHEPGFLASAGVARDCRAAAGEGHGGEHAGCVTAIGEFREDGERLGSVWAVQRSSGHLGDDRPRVHDLPRQPGSGTPCYQGGPAQGEHHAESQQEQPPRGAQRLEVA